MAGYKWLESFLRRNPEISIRKSENTSIARAKGMSKETVERYFKELGSILTNNDLFDKPGSIFNCDETGLQLNTRPGQVLAAKGSKNVSSISSGEKGETVSVLSCINAEGGYLPPYCVFKGKNIKTEWHDGLPPGSKIRMSEKSAYVTSDIFFDWLKNHFFTRKPRTTKVLIILDGHASHTTNFEMLEFAEQNDIILFCLPPHCTAYLQPLDRAFFKALKAYYYQAARNLQKSNPGQKIGRLQFGKLLGEAWGKSASVQNALSAFKSTGIVPFDPSVIPDYAYLCIINDSANDRPDSLTEIDSISEPNPLIICNNDISESTPSTSRQQDHSEITPGKALDQISPVPVINPKKVLSVRRKIVASSVLTSSEHIKFRKEKFLQRSKKQKIVEPKKQTKAKKSIQSTKLKSRKTSRSSSSAEEDLSLNGSSDDENISDYENECVGCGEDYRKTKKAEDWIKCLICGRWLHEGCTPFLNLCVQCSKHAMKKK